MIATEQKQIVAERLTMNATAKDFCRIFKDNVDPLYQLSLLLMADDHSAEQCFVESLEDCTQNPNVAKEWAYRWSRRTIIKHAIGMISPGAQRSDGASPRVGDKAGWRSRLSGAFAQITHLPSFERFVYVMSILEGYSDQECALLLKCRRQEVTAARVHILSHLSQVANAPETFGPGASIPPEPTKSLERAG